MSLLQLLADGVIPNEYGINPNQKLKIGSKVIFLPLLIFQNWIKGNLLSPTFQNSIYTDIFLQIARRLLGKILIDLRNTREEAISVSELKGNQDQLSELTKTDKKDNEFESKAKTKSDESRRLSTSDMPKIYTKNDDFKRCSTSDISVEDDDDDKETKYRLDPKWVLAPFF